MVVEAGEWEVEGAAESRSRAAQSGSDRRTAEQLGACAKVRAGGLL